MLQNVWIVIHYDCQMIHYSVISMKLKHVFFEYNKKYSRCIHISFVHSMVDYYGLLYWFMSSICWSNERTQKADYPKNLRINYLHSPYISIFPHIIQSQILMTSDLFSLISTLMDGTKVVIFRSKMNYILFYSLCLSFHFIIYERIEVISIWLFLSCSMFYALI